MTDDPSLAAFSNVVIARLLFTWEASDASVAVQIASPPWNGFAQPVGLCLDHRLTVSVVLPDQRHTNDVANTPHSAEELSRHDLNLKVPCPKR